MCGNRWAFQNRSEGITNLTHPEVMLPLKELSGIECKKDSRVWTPTIGRMRWGGVGELVCPPRNWVSNGQFKRTARRLSLGLG